MNYIERSAKRIRVTAPTSAPRGLLLMYALLVFTTGAETTRENVHDAWAAWTSAVDPGNPHLVPFSELPESEQIRDQKYVTAIRAEALRLAGPGTLAVTGQMDHPHQVTARAR